MNSVGWSKVRSESVVLEGPTLSQNCLRAALDAGANAEQVGGSGSGLRIEIPHQGAVSIARSEVSATGPVHHLIGSASDQPDRRTEARPPGPGGIR
jgi:hypothetical protein